MLIEARDGATVVLTLNQPARRNALAMPMREALIEALDRIEADTSVRAVVINGAGGHFCAGGDISGMDVTGFGAGRERFRTTHRLVRLILESSKPFVAAVDGWAAGAGVGLAICCDTVVAASDASFMTPFGRIGLIADFALLHTLPRRIGEGRARQMFLAGEAIDAATAERWGLVDHVVAPGATLEKALERAAKLSAAAPLTTAMTKSILARGLAETLEWERTVHATMFMTGDHEEGKTAFLGKRAPSFKGI
ncbi:MAG: enoyl-CoA hydratase/isomerase family protein [Acetobacteraceae bacterium]|nr:enoyl-CoA hydratase/isomerase family protein [Acetobacteraceae bacterium]